MFCCLVGILKQKRLTIVVNKIDVALKHKFGEKPLQKDDIVKKVKKFLSKKVFGCLEHDVPDDCIILVCGQWAYHSRLYLNGHDTNTELVETIDEEMTSSLKIMKSDIHKKELREEVDHKVLALHLLEQSNIKVLEKRYT